jgi:polyhydroxyalkanoate synthesis regulator phasin
MSNQKAQQVLQELVTTNDWARQSVGQYKAEYFKNLISLLQSNQHSSLQDLIKELEDRLVDMEAGE